jgi:hypothetical protein
MVALGQYCGLSEVFDTQLGHDATDVRFDGGWPDHQLVGELGVGVATDHQIEHLPLLGGEILAWCRWP